MRALQSRKLRIHMAHGVFSLANGKSSMVARNGDVWHGLFQEAGQANSIVQFLSMLGNPSYREEPLFVKLGDIDTIVPGKKAIVCSLNENVVGMVSDRYKFIQPERSFEEGIGPFLATGDVSLETAGVVFDGKRIWMLAKIEREEAEIVTGDKVVKYLLVSDTFDGTHAMNIALVGTRVVCDNTLRMALSEDAQRVLKISHRGNVGDKLARASQAIDLVNREFDSQILTLGKLERVRVSRDQAVKFFKNVTATGKAKAEQAQDGIPIDILWEVQAERGAEALDGILAHTSANERTKESRIVENMLAIFEEHGIGNSISQTAHGLYETVTEYTSHHGHNRGQEARIESVAFGHLGRMNERAYEEVVKFL